MPDIRRSAQQLQLHSPQWGGTATSWDWSASGGAVGGSDDDLTAARLVATSPANQYSRSGSDRIKVYWFDRTNFRKHHVNLTGEEATRILGPSWWATISHLSQLACDSWPTSAPVTAANYH